MILAAFQVYNLGVFDLDFDNIIYYINAGRICIIKVRCIDEFVYKVYI